MSDLYTSLSTSVALRDAGAPQTGDLATYWCDGFSAPCVHSHCTLIHNGATVIAYHPRAFRADEIIEAMKPRGAMEFEFLDDGVVVWPWNRSCVSGSSFVEALAQAWLAVLKEE